MTNVLPEELRKCRKHCYLPIVVLVVTVSLPIINGSHFTDFPLCREDFFFIDAEIDQLTQGICDSRCGNSQQFGTHSVLACSFVHRDRKKEIEG